MAPRHRHSPQQLKFADRVRRFADFYVPAEDNPLNHTASANYDVKLNWNRTTAHQIWGKYSFMNAVVDDLTNYLGPDPNATGDGGFTKVWQATGEWLLFVDADIGFDLFGVITRGQLLSMPMFILGVGLLINAYYFNTKIAAKKIRK